MRHATSSQYLEEARQPLGATLYDYCVRSHLWVAGAVTSLAAFSMKQLELGTSLTSLAIVFFSTLLIYNLDTTLDLRGVGSNGAPPFEGNAADLPTRQLRASGLCCGALASLLASLIATSWQTAIWVLAGAAICCLYAVPLGSRRLRMKALPGAKSLVVGSAVAIAVVTVPWVEAGSSHALSLDRPAWYVLWFVATLTTVNATLFDIRDLRQDQLRGLRTLPVVFGLSATRRALVLAAVVSFLALALLVPELRLDAMLLLATLVPLTLTLSPGSPRSAYAWLVDGALFLPWLVSFLG